MKNEQKCILINIFRVTFSHDNIHSFLYGTILIRKICRYIRVSTGVYLLTLHSELRRAKINFNFYEKKKILYWLIICNN